MKKINDYILEKFKITKNTKVPSTSGVHPKYVEIIDIIEDFLRKTKHFGYNSTDFIIKGESGHSISLICPKDCQLSKEKINYIGISIAKEIGKLNLDWYWSFEKDINKFTWSEGII